MYVKVFAQILHSSIADDWQVRLVFEDFLKLADWHGVVDMTPESIARRTNVPLDIVKAGIAALCAPDPQSRTPDHEGRRLIPLADNRDWGWQIVNYKSYREMRDEDAKREYMRGWMRNKRAAVSQELAPLADAEGEKEAKIEAEVHPPYSEIQEAWNAEAAKLKLPQCRDMTDKRRAAIRNRWTNEAWRKEWQAALSKIKDRPFLLGSKGWMADIDWFLRPDSVVKIMEGKYADSGMTATQEREHYAHKQEIRRHEPPPPAHPLIARLRELMKATNSATLTATYGGQEWRAYAIDKETVFLDAMVDGKSVQKRVKADALTQFRELQ